VAATAFIADHDAAFRGIVRGAIEGLVRILGEADNDDAALLLVRALEPDVILIDLDLPRAGGIATAWRVKSEQPAIRVILMAGHGEEAYLEATGKAGADAFLRKQHARNEAPTVLRRVAGGVLRPWERRRR
jgi:DNA-binding NarL/FixJ family response regulator